MDIYLIKQSKLSLIINNRQDITTSIENINEDFDKLVKNLLNLDFQFDDDFRYNFWLTSNSSNPLNSPYYYILTGYNNQLNTKIQKIKQSMLQDC